MNEIRIKFRSERGASITFSLLLFLVCAVVGSVILVAATAASGRLSQLAESDQRYYSVTSAAELLKGKLHNQSVTVVTTTKKVSTKTYNYNGSVYSSSEPDVITRTIDGEACEPAYYPDSLLKDAAYKLKIDPAATTFPVEDSFLLSASENTSLDVRIDAKLDKNDTNDGIITLILKNEVPSEEGGASASTGNVYSLKITLQPELTESTDTQKHTGTPVSVSGGYTITTTETQITTTTFIWKVTDITTVVSGS